MSTNFYYIESAPCECCKREYPEIHLGKRYNGWTFILHAYSRQDTWESIKSKLLPVYSIRDEYGREYTYDEIVKIVEGWQEGKKHANEFPEDYSSWIDPVSGFAMSEGDWS